MATSNTDTSFGTVSKTFHWLTALIILAAFPLGVIAYDAPYETAEQLTRKATLFSIHKTLGVTAFFVALARILWSVTQTRPAPLHPDRKAETFLADLVHWLLYGAMLLIPLTGWIHHAATEGFAPIWWPLGQSLPFVPKSPGLAAVFGGIHTTLTILLALSVALHVAGALKHHVIDRDATLRRMWFGATQAPDDPRQTGSHTKPALAAVALFALALSYGVLSAKTDQPEIAAASLAEVDSSWTVQDGALTIQVKQFGSDVTGTFAEWTAAIEFSETATDGLHGTVDVAISIGSLTLGSVTAEAMGPEYFDTANHPTARFVADILAAEGDGYLAQGNLTLRGAEVPVTLPFRLEFAEDGTARMTGTTQVDRRDYAIGASQSDESSLGFAVGVSVDLTARLGDAEQE